MTVAFAFPGQGSQHPGMGAELAAAHPEARAVFEAVDDALGIPLSTTCFEGTAEQLAMTETTQPAILAVSVAAWRCLAARGVQPNFVAGHSLGEWSALVAAGTLSVTDAARAVRLRGRYMQEAVPPGVGAMAAIIGGEEAAVRAACEEATRDGELASPANFNAPGQIVIAGHAAAVERAIAGCLARGARKAMKLPVSAPFHCALMEPAAARLASDLERVSFAAPSVPLIANVTAAEVTDGEAARGLLRQQVTAPVRWHESVERLVSLGVDTVVEVGPGKVLAGLIRRIAKDIRVLNASTPQEIEAVAGALAA